MTETSYAVAQAIELPTIAEGPHAAATANAETGSADAGSAETAPSRLGYALRLLGSRPGLVLSILWVAVLAVAAFAPGLFTHTNPLSSIALPRLAPSGAHVFGTDEIGRDLFTRVVYGTRLSLEAAAVAIAIGLVIGTLLGLLAGYLGGWVDVAVMRVVDVLLSIPSILLALAFVVALGFGTVEVAIAVGLTSIAGNARILRSEVLRVRNSTYVEAARAGGARTGRVLFRHVLPNSITPLLALLALDFSSAILAISSLSFLGYGAPPPAPEWGALVSSGRDFLSTAWWLTTLPGAVIALTVLAGNRISRAFTGEGGIR